MYLVDSPTKNIFKYDYDLETGSVSNRRVFFHVDDENGVPDGHVPDEEGCIWQAIVREVQCLALIKFGHIDFPPVSDLGEQRREICLQGSNMFPPHPRSKKTQPDI
jgi:sugar lactone lactonase YvrE